MTLEEMKAYAELNSCDSPSLVEREKMFWKSLGNACRWNDPIYGADMEGGSNDKWAIRKFC
jgi:hypothetical protein